MRWGDITSTYFEHWIKGFWDSNLVNSNGNGFYQTYTAV